MIPPTLWAGPPLLPLRWGDAAVGVGRNQKHHRRPPNRSQIGPLLKNGTLDAATTPATAANTPRATTAPVLIGGDSSTHRFSGTLDDVSIYGRALSDREIADLANIVDKRYQYHHLNALGSNIVLTNDNQKVLVRYEYDIFGAIRSETGTCDNTRKFTGKEFDADSNLYYYGARYYDPYIGRFTQRDPIGDGVNWYAYVANNPLKFIDPTGMRGVNAKEREALTFTFGPDVGGLLADRINIEFPDGLTYKGLVPKRTLDGKRNVSEIHLHKDYDENNLYAGVFLSMKPRTFGRSTPTVTRAVEAESIIIITPANSLR